MLKSIDILLGLSVVMLMVSLVVTVLTQAITNLMQSRGKNLRDGIAGLLRQIHRDLPPGVSREIAEAILTHPLIKSAGSRFGTVIHREELTAPATDPTNSPIRRRRTSAPCSKRTASKTRQKHWPASARWP